MSRTFKDTKAWKKEIASHRRFWWKCVGGVPSWYKAMTKRTRRAKCKQALTEGREIPRFKKTDEWAWW